MFDRLEELVDKLDTINNQLTDPDVEGAERSLTYS